MNKLTTLLALIPLLIILSCNKDDPHNPGSGKVLDFLEFTTFPDTLYYEFNDDKQIIREEDNNGRTTVAVNGSQLHILDFRKSENRTVADATLTLNAADNIISGTANISYSPSDPYSTTYTFEYNTEGYLTRRTDTRSNGVTWSYNFYWTNGDLTKWEWVNQDTLYLTFYMEYDSSLPDKLQLDYNKFSLIGTTSWTGKSSAHLPIRNYRIFDSDNQIVYDYHYDYTLDNDGYVSSYVIDDALSTYTDTVKYHYK